MKFVFIGGKYCAMSEPLARFDCVLFVLHLRRFCPLGSAPLAPVFIAFRLTASAPWLLIAICLRRNRAAKFSTSTTAKSLNLNIRDLFASKFSGRPRDFKISLFINLDRNLFAFYFTKDKIAPKRSVDLDYFRIFS